MVSRTLKEEQIEPAAGIGYTALAAVLDRPDPTRGTVTSNTQQTTVTANMPEGPLELPPLPSVPFMERSGGGSMSSHREIPSFGLSDSTLIPHERPEVSLLRRESSRASATEHTFSTRSSNNPLSSTNITDITTPRSSGGMEDAMEKMGLVHESPKEATRVVVDPTHVERRAPKRRTDRVVSKMMCKDDSNHAVAVWSWMESTLFFIPVLASSTC